VSSLATISLWVLASVAVSLAVGFYLGRGMAHARRQPPGSGSERQAALATLVDLLKLVEELTSDVDTRSSEMQAVRSHMDDMHVTGELETIRQVLLKQVAAVLDSNQKLEDDLIYARCRMEQQAQEIDRTRQEAHTDALTGVGNRKAFDESLLLLLGAHKRGGDSFVLLLADMDHFKWVNDTHGHQAGDNVLRQLGELLKACVRDGDIVSRYGGDEFAILLPKAELNIGFQVADRIRLESTRSNFGLNSDREEGAVTLSIGVAVAQGNDTPESIIERADQALYNSKRGGRNQVQVHSGQDRESRPDAERAVAVG